MRLGKSSLFLIAMLTSGAAFAGAPGWSISESSGQVSVVSTGLVKAAVRGGAVATGDIINTGRNGRAVLVRGEEYLVVSPNTRIRVADPAKSGGLTQIVEHFGNVIYKIKKMTMPHFAVETPFLAAVVKGTTFSVTVTEKGAAVQVTEGRVEVATRDGGASFMVLPGDIGSVSASAPATLNVQGRENRSISSPTPAAAAAAVTASVEMDAPVASPATPDAPTEQAQFSGSIDKPVSEGAVNLSAMSDGMVSGDSSMTAMTSLTKTAAAETPRPAPAAEVADVVVATSPVTASVTAPPSPAGSAAMDPMDPETVDPVPPVPVDVIDAGGKPPPTGPKPVIVLGGPPVQAVIKPEPASLPPGGVSEAPPIVEVVVALPPTILPTEVLPPAPAPAPAVETVEVVALPPTPAPEVVVAAPPVAAPPPAAVVVAATPVAAPPPAAVVAAAPAPVAVVGNLPAPAPSLPSIIQGIIAVATNIATQINNNNSGPGNWRTGNGGFNGNNGNDSQGKNGPKR